MPIVFKFCFICILIKLLELTESTETIEMQSNDDLIRFLENCPRIPYYKKIEEGDGGFLIRMLGNSDRYTPSKEYTVILENENENTTFSTFYLVTAETNLYVFDAGNIKIMNKTFSTLYRQCAIKYTSAVPKNQIQFSWIAPKTNHACVTFKATILDSNGHWYEDQNRLTLKICPDATDCELSEWDEWSQCSTTCGNGYQVRSRSIKEYERFGGKPCVAYLYEAKKCEMPSCSLENVQKECQLIEWSEWSQCPITCGNGWEIRVKNTNRTTKQNGRNSCISEIDLRNCKTPPCNLAYVPDECHLAEWTEWSQCSRTCGYGWQTRRKLVEKIETNEGIRCPPEDEVKSCEMRQCQLENVPNECHLAEWAEWSQCSTTCGYGWQTRRKLIEKIKTNEGKPCTPEDEVKSCEMPACQSDADINSCNVMEWSRWGSCNTTCGIGMVNRTRNYLHNFASHRNCNVSLLDTEICYGFCDGEPFPSHFCTVTEWSNWTKCSCGRKYRARKRKYVTPMPFQREWCFILLEDRENCPITPACNSSEECGVTGWTEWTSCREICIGNTRRRTRMRIRAIIYPSYNVKCNIEFYQIVNCSTNIVKCGEIDEAYAKINATDCELLEWGEWSQCSTTCGSGYQTRRKYVKEGETFGGTTCADYVHETKICEMPPCDVRKGGSDCQLSEWSEWNQCSTTCGSGRQMRKRHIEKFERNGGKPCEGFFREMKMCEMPQCVLEKVPNECDLVEWSEWSRCSRTCGNGYQTRRRLIEKFEENGGKSCPPEADLKRCKMPPCHPQNVPNECDLVEWAEWSQCSRTCGNGWQTRRKLIDKKIEKNGRKKCLSKRFEKKKCKLLPCNLENIPDECHLTEWIEWSQCSRTCGNGWQTRRRLIEKIEKTGGKPCQPKLLEKKKCKRSPCQPCDVTAWSSWSQCSSNCGIGVHKRTRNYLNKFAIRRGCNVSLIDERICHSDLCNGNLTSFPLLCNVSEWSDWTECSCSSKYRFRRREYGNPLSNVTCHLPLEERKKCPIPSPCIYPGECGVSDWSGWSECSKECGKNTQVRIRMIDNPVIYATCNIELYQKVNCTPDRPITCEENNSGSDLENTTNGYQLTEWTEWSECSTTCGTGQQVRKRMIEKIEKNIDKPWPPKLLEEKECNTPSCLCFEPKIEEHGCNETFLRWHYDSSAKSCNIYNSCRENGNKTRTENLSECIILCRRILRFNRSCPYYHWSEWTPCSVTCGTGIQYRGRKPNYGWDFSKYERLKCKFQVQQKNCYKPYCIHH